MSIIKFIPSKSHQWINYNFYIYIWVASDICYTISDNISKQLINTKVINKTLVSSLIKKINYYYEIIVIIREWFFLLLMHLEVFQCIVTKKIRSLVNDMYSTLEKIFKIKLDNY